MLFDEVFLVPKYISNVYQLFQTSHIRWNIFKILIFIIASAIESQNIFGPWVHHFLVKDLPDISHDAEFSLTKLEKNSN